MIARALGVVMLVTLSVALSAADEIAELRAEADDGDAAAQYTLGFHFSENVS